MSEVETIEEVGAIEEPEKADSLESSEEGPKLTSLATPFSMRKRDLCYRDTPLVRFLRGVAVMNMSLRKDFTLPEIETFDNILVEITQSGIPVVRVQAMQEFFDGKKQFEKISASPREQGRRLLEAVGFSLSEEEIRILEGYDSLRQKIIAHFSGFAPSYPFAEKQVSEERLRINADGAVEAGGYRLSKTQARNIWNRARPVWEKGETDNGTGSVAHDYTRHKIRIHRNRVEIGCQRVSRWQVEQAALELGFI